MGIPVIVVIADFIVGFPECGWPGWTVQVEVFVEPVSEDAAGGAGAADLDAFASPAFFAVLELVRKNGVVLVWVGGG